VTDFTATNQDAVLHDVYSDDKVQEQSYGKNPLYGFVSKKRGQMAGGRRYVQVVEFSNPGGATSDYANAMTDNTTSQYEDFLIPRKFQYQRIKVAHELLFATEKKSESFVKALAEFDRGFKSFGEVVGRRLYRTQGGAIGKLAISSTTTTTLLFSDNAAVFNFFIGQKLQFAAADGSGSLRDSGDFVTVTGVDHEAGTVTIDVDLATQVSAVATTDFVFTRGTFNACLAGLEDWLPVDSRSTKLAATFNGVTRSAAPVYMGGLQMDGTTFGGLDEVMIKLAGKIGKYGGDVDYAFANNESMSDLELISNSRIRILGALRTGIQSQKTGDIVVGFNGYKVLVGGREVDVYPDRNCPSNRFYMLQLNTWTLWHTGDLINWLGESYTGHKMQPSQNDDSAESRLGSYMNLGCSAPGYNGVAKINAST
jgi:hypothetical protein